MNGKSKVRKIIGSGTFLLCMIVAVLFAAFYMNSNAETGGIQYVQREVGAEEVPTMDKYLFAGWYSEENDTKPIEAPVTGETYYAKFVPASVLDIKAQVSNTLLENSTLESAAIRFVTTIDSLQYQKIGFILRKGAGSEADAKVTNLVYEELYQVSNAEGEVGKISTVEPTMFDATSKYFKTYTIRKVPGTEYNTDITVTPYWITLDGTKVIGTKSIKTVNLQRSWIYVDTQANADAKECGTYNHPYTTLDAALDEIFLENKGKVIAKGNSPIEVPTDFEWTKHTVTDGDKEQDCNITITGENASAGFDFSTFSPLDINDNVVFDNMTLKFPAANVYANGNQLVINETVVSENPSTTIFGGGYKTDLSSGTNVEIHAGSYKEIWGGNKDGGSITGDIHVTVTNTDIFNDAKDTRRVFGGGWGASTVNGDIYVTIGQDFNKNYTQPIDEYENVLNGTHTRKSAVYGAGAGGEVVKGSTYVTIKNNAKVDYVYGGGSASSGIVEGTCHVTLDGGVVFSIYGGAMGDTAVTDTAKYRNKDTAVTINGGEVYQIIGGNGSGMAGNTLVEILGGKVHRRIYGGCYSDTKYVEGRTTVVVQNSDSLVFDLLFAEKLYAGSSVANNAREIKTLIFDDIYSSSKLGSENYNYLVTKRGDGTIAAGKTGVGEGITVDGNTLQVTPVTDATPGSITKGDVKAYFQGAGKYVLAETTDNSKNSVVVDFAPSESIDLTACEARIDGMYYDTLKGAVADAIVRNDVPIVTLRKDVTLEKTLDIPEGADIALQSEKDQNYTLTGDTTLVSEINSANTGELIYVAVNAKLDIQNVTLSGGNLAIRSLGRLEPNTITINSKKGIYLVRGSAIIHNPDITATSNQAIQLDNCYAEIYDARIKQSGAAAVRIQNSTVILKDSSLTNTKAYSIYVADKESDVTVENVTITGIQASCEGVYLNKGSLNATNLTVEGNGKPAVTARNDAKATFVASTFSTTGANTVVTEGTAEVTLTDAKIERKESSTNALLVINAGTTVNMNEVNAGTASIDGKKGSFTGRAVEVAGTFNLNGGAIKDNKISTNTASTLVTENTNNGAGVYVVAGGTFNMNGGCMTGNEATGAAGAAVAVHGAATEGVEAAKFNLTGGVIGTTIEANKTTDGNTAAWGAVMARSGEFNMSGGTIAGNKATTSGGGVAVSKGAFTMTDGEIRSNSATTGGGMFMNSTGSISIEGGKIMSNTASTGDGGGVHVTNGNFSMTAGEITDNHADKKAGGGICINHANTVVAISGGTISENTAVNGAGIILRAFKSISMTGGTIKLNDASENGGGIYLATGTFEMKGGTIQGNEALGTKQGGKGGGIYLPGGQTVKLTSGTVTGNTNKDTNPSDVEAVNDSNGTLTIAADFNIGQAKGTFIVKTVTDNRP